MNCKHCGIEPKIKYTKVNSVVPNYTFIQCPKCGFSAGMFGVNTDDRALKHWERCQKIFLPEQLSLQI